MFENFRVRAKIVDQVLPRDWRRDQAVNKQDRNLVGIVRMNQINAGSKTGVIGSKECSSSAAGDFSGVREKYSQGGCVISCDGMRAICGSGYDGI